MASQGLQIQITLIGMLGNRRISSPPGTYPTRRAGLEGQLNQPDNLVQTGNLVQPHLKFSDSSPFLRSPFYISL